MTDVNDFSKFRIGLAGSDDIRGWSHGEVKKPETINYRTLKPEKDGLFCEKIFGPMRDWECQCGKYKRIRFKGIICERCGVEVTRSKVRRERMGHIELASPVAHIWYLRGTRSWLTYLLMNTDHRDELKANQLEKVIYFSAYLIVGLDSAAIRRELPQLELEMDEYWQSYFEQCDIYRERLYFLLDALSLEMEAELEKLEAASGGGKAAGSEKAGKSSSSKKGSKSSDPQAQAERLKKDYDARIKQLEEEIAALTTELEEVLNHRLGYLEVQAKRLDKLSVAAAAGVDSGAGDGAGSDGSDDADSGEADSDGDSDAAADQAAAQAAARAAAQAAAQAEAEELAGIFAQAHGERLELIEELKNTLDALQAEASEPRDRQEVLDPNFDIEQTLLEQQEFRLELEQKREEAEAEELYLGELAKLHARQVIDDIRLFHALDVRFGPNNQAGMDGRFDPARSFFEAGMGAEAIVSLIHSIDFELEEKKLRAAINPQEGKRALSEQRREKALKRLEILSAFNTKDEAGRLNSEPSSIVLDAIPVIPPDLRPMVQLDGGRFATSDLNDLYRRVINRNNRLKRLMEIEAPDIIINNEKRMLQKSIDALFDNGRRGKPVLSQNNRPLKSLSDMLKGKQGRFRLNLLGKRVDYSGRSVIVAGPTLKFHQCGIPRLMALELFKPFVIRELERRNIATYIKSAKRMVEDTISGRSRTIGGAYDSLGRPATESDIFKMRSAQVWEVLSEVVKEHPVMLNRAPTLHRLGIQAFEPVLVHGKAIRLHPLVCTAFNADFDGDQMAVLLPLSAEARAEAEVLMLSANNLLSPANGRPLVTPTQDMIIGAYYLTQVVTDGEGAGRAFRTYEQVERAVESGSLSVHAPIEFRIPALLQNSKGAAGSKGAKGSKADTSAQAAASASMFGVAPDELSELTDAFGERELEYVPTTAGRVIFNDALPEDFPYVNDKLDRRLVGALVEELAYNHSRAVTADSLDKLKSLCFRWASKSGLTVSVDDIKTPPAKTAILDRSEREAEKVERNFERGIITDAERRQQEVEIWTEATNEVRQHLEEDLRSDTFNPVDMMISSGARSNMMQVRQIAGMRGLVANPRGDMIPRPIKSNFKEGLSTLEYFISTPGARKGLVDTALRTADSGYLTRRLVDVAQEVIINDSNPFESGRAVPSLLIDDVRPDTPSERSHLETRLFGRVLAEDVELSDGTVIEKAELVTRELMERLRDDPDVTQVRVLSPLTDESEHGISALSYGMSMATGKLIEVGEAVGVIAAQSIGEPGTQLTMRTFHTGGVVGKDLADGLPRVVELFEARSPKGKAVVAGISGTVRITEGETAERTVLIHPVGEGDPQEIPVSRGQRLEVEDGQEVLAGDVLVDGPLDPKELLSIKGIRATQQYLVEQVQKVYREQGVSIHEKHIEIIVRQMTRRITVESSGDSEFLSGAVVDARVYRDVNRQLISDGKRPASGRPELMGITKASLATDSWLAAASFQETTRVLTAAAIASKSDDLKGLKENIVIGKLIPAGTGVKAYRNIVCDAPDYVPMESYSSDDEDMEHFLGMGGEQTNGEGGFGDEGEMGLFDLFDDNGFGGDIDDADTATPDDLPEAAGA